uniref:phage tail sheath family protein n=1 Tax=Sphingomonas bacterium TaxID=1895847 RepID=UPI0026195E27|nr:phage tail sheath C-terminal domain-containing protein [Sphingomonas bacterium]
MTEPSAFPRPVTGVATALPAFIGYTEKAPDAGQVAAGLAAEIESMEQYRALFGGGWSGDSAGAAPILYESLELFFGNGGTRCLIASVGSFADFAGDLVKEIGLRPERMWEGLAAIEAQPGPTLLLAPDALAMADDDYFPFACAMVQQAAQLGDRFAILDVPGGGDPANRTPALIDAVMARFHAGISPVGDGRSFGGAYFPWLKTVIGGVRRVLPAAPAIAGIYAANDEGRGVWTAPAGMSVAMIEGPTIPVDADEQAGMNLPVDGLAVNAIRDFPGRGTLVWGARTLDGNSDDYRYIHARRTLIYLDQSIRTGLRQFAFAPNDATTWAAVTAMLSAFLTDLWQAGGLFGATASGAFTISCGIGSTMSGQDVLAGMLRLRIAVALIHPAEFITLDFAQQTAIRPQPAL